MGKVATFVLTLLNIMMFITLAATYSSAKPILTRDFGFSQTFLGAIDLVTFVLRSVCTIYLIVMPPKKLNYVYFLSTLVQVIGIVIVAAIVYVDTLQKLIVMIGMSIFGLARGTLPVPLILLLTEFDVETNSKQIAVWTGLGGLGMALGFAYSQLMFQILNFPWHFSLIILMLIYLLVSALMLIMVKETDVDRFQDHSFCERVQSIKETFLFFTKKTSNAILTVEAVIVENVRFVVQFWSAVYLTNAGLSRYDKLLPLAFAIMTFTGPFLISLVAGTNIKHKNISISIFIILQTGAFAWLIFLSGDESQISQYLIIYIMIGVTFGGLQGWITSSEVVEKVQGNLSDRYSIVSLLATYREFFSAVSLQLYGFLMDLNNDFYAYLSVTIGMIIFILNLSKVYFRHKQAQERNADQPNNLMEQENPQ